MVEFQLLQVDTCNITRGICHQILSSSKINPTWSIFAAAFQERYGLNAREERNNCAREFNITSATTLSDYKQYDVGIIAALNHRFYNRFSKDKKSKNTLDKDSRSPKRSVLILTPIMKSTSLQGCHNMLDLLLL